MFGPVPLISVRLVLAAACLSPVMISRENRETLLRHWKALLFVGIFNSALPFSLLAFATLSVEAGFASLLNATTPLFAAAVGAVWLRAPLRRAQILGLAIGFAGVAILAWGRLSFRPGGSGWAIIAALGATLSYGVSAHFTKRHLAAVPPVVLCAGSMWAAAATLLPLGLHLWPSTTPPLPAWGAVAVLAVVCTVAAYILYFSLLRRAGVTAASAVTFIVPVFAILWGAIWLHEPLTLRLAFGMAVTLLGTAFTTGLLAGPAKSPQPIPVKLPADSSHPPSNGLTLSARTEAPTSPLFGQPFEPSSKRRCHECGKLVAEQNSIGLGGFVICSSCKPAALAKLKGGDPDPIGDDLVWRDRKTVVVGARATMPDRCVKCNAPAEGIRISCSVSWKWGNLNQPQTSIEIGLCEAHRRRGSVHARVGLLLIIAIILITISRSSQSNRGFYAMGLLLLFAGLQWAIPSVRFLAANRDWHWIYLKGAGREFLESLEEFPKVSGK